MLRLPEHVNYKPHCNPETSHCTEHRWWPLQPDHHTGSIVLVYPHETWSVKKEDDQQRRLMHFELPVCTWGNKTHTCPSGAYVEPVIVNSLREQLFPFAWSTMNICNKTKKTLKSSKISTSRWQNNPLQNMSDVWKHPYSTWPGFTSTTDVNTLYDTHLRVNLSSEGL